MFTANPATTTFTCDVCGVTSIEPHHRDRPAHWSELIIARHAYDFQGCAVADASVRRHLCAGCTDGAAKAINDWAATIGRKPQ